MLGHCWQNIVLFLVKSFSRSITSNATKCWVVNCRKLFGSPGNSRSAQKKKNSDQLKTRHLEKSPPSCWAMRQFVVEAVGGHGRLASRWNFSSFQGPKEFSKDRSGGIFLKRKFGAQPSWMGERFTNPCHDTKIQIHIHKYKYTNTHTKTQVQMHKFRAQPNWMGERFTHPW